MPPRLNRNRPGDQAVHEAQPRLSRERRKDGLGRHLFLRARAGVVGLRPEGIRFVTLGVGPREVGSGLIGRGFLRGGFGGCDLLCGNFLCRSLLGGCFFGSGVVRRCFLGCGLFGSRLRSSFLRGSLLRRGVIGCRLGRRGYTPRPPCLRRLCLRRPYPLLLFGCDFVCGAFLHSCLFGSGHCSGFFSSCFSAAAFSRSFVRCGLLGRPIPLPPFPSRPLSAAAGFSATAFDNRLFRRRLDGRGNAWIDRLERQ